MKLNISGFLGSLWSRPDPVIAEAAAALAGAAEGMQVALVSGGDPGVFAMAAAVCEAIEKGPADWRGLDVAFLPGITAMLAVAAKVGAPLGHDFCAMSLSDNLKPWEVIERRLDAAAGAGFVIAIYNPISRARPSHSAKYLACRQLRTITTMIVNVRTERPPTTIAPGKRSNASSLSVGSLLTTLGSSL